MLVEHYKYSCNWWKCILYNETNGVSVFPTPSIAMVGVNEDAQNVLPSKLQESGNVSISFR